ncbi:MAG: phosphohydrolase [Parasphingorhabdus sp.]
MPVARSPIDDIFAIIREYGDLSYGEDVTQMDHILQCGHLAKADGGSDALIAASLLHDIGQFMEDAGSAAEQRGIDARHEVKGAEYLAGYFPEAVTEPVRLHVEAKRYLCATEPGYLQSLSHASALSLELQGGPHHERQVKTFAALPFASDALRLRRYDDMGKKHDQDVPVLETYRPLLESLLLR